MLFILSRALPSLSMIYCTLISIHRVLRCYFTNGYLCNASILTVLSSKSKAGLPEEGGRNAIFIKWLFQKS